MNSAAPQSALATRWPLVRCVKWGAAVGGVYALMALLVSGMVPDFQARYGIGLGLTIAIDLIGGVSGGTLVGLMLPRVRGLPGFIFAAQASLVPTYLLFALSAPRSEGIELIDGLVAAILVGAFVGVAIWRRHSPEKTS